MNFQTVRGNELYSKEQCGSIVNETLRNRVLITIDTSKESNFDAYSKYLKSVEFNVTLLKLITWENLPNFWKIGENLPKRSSDITENDTIRFRISEIPSEKV